MKTILVALAALALPTAAMAQALGTDTAEITGNNREEPRDRSEEAGDGERQICRRIRASNSHQSRRVCMTREQWRDYNR